MKRCLILFVYLFFAAVLAVNAQDEKRIKIACVGNSITEGAAATDRKTLGYVGILSELMGDKYDVQNFGVSGANATRGVRKPYETTDRFTPAKEFQPDIVTIKLGTNDSQPAVWNENGDNPAEKFRQGLLWLCDEFEELESKPQIYLCLPIPIIPSERWKHQPDVLDNQIIPIIKEVVRERGYKLIDLHTPLIGRVDCYPPDDMLHPSNRGHLVIAAEMYKALITYNK